MDSMEHDTRMISRHDSSDSENIKKQYIEATLESGYPIYTTGQVGVDQSDYTNMLITILRKRNQSLNFIWPALLLMAMVLAFTTIYFYQEVKLKELENLQQQKAVSAAEAKITQKQTELDLLTERQQSTTEEFNTLQRQLLALAEANLEQTKGDTGAKAQLSGFELVSALQGRLQQAEEQASLLAGENTILQKQIEQAKQDHSNTLEAYNALQNRVKEKTDELASTMEVIDTLNSERETKLNETLKQLSMFKQENIKLQKEVNKRKAAFDALAKRYRDTQGLYDVARKKVNELSAEHKANDNTVSQLQKNLTATQKQLTEIQQSYDQLSSEYQTFKANLIGATQPIKARTQPSTTPASPVTKPAPVPQTPTSSTQQTEGSAQNLKFPEATLE
ncbi:hypothetical protein OLMES_3799 [Oleiphilus messinensis]|uniref:Chromosome segregation ATPase n=1 Tax=Oleiphilus messinensis TaxID=141451 RepID=A0A1Y0ICF3_9GAMM|nr:hypothetical protein [Oleiphilus messinensis]ARU57819.1 hypothetical protein OLMES_3799 [Oleiphilus messinensis]